MKLINSLAQSVEGFLGNYKWQGMTEKEKKAIKATKKTNPDAGLQQALYRILKTSKNHKELLHKMAKDDEEKGQAGTKYLRAVWPVMNTLTEEQKKQVMDKAKAYIEYGPPVSEQIQ